MSYKEFVNQQFDQLFSYSNIQKCILSADSLLSPPQGPLFQNLGIDPKSKTNSKATSKKSNMEGLTFIEKIEHIALKKKSNKSFNPERYYFCTPDSKRASSHQDDDLANMNSQETVEFDLIMNLCALEMNVICIKKKVKHVYQQNFIYQRELFLNLSHVNTNKQIESLHYNDRK